MYHYNNYYLLLFSLLPCIKKKCILKGSVRDIYMFHVNNDFELCLKNVCLHRHRTILCIIFQSKIQNIYSA